MGWDIGISSLFYEFMSEAARAASMKHPFPILALLRLRTARRLESAEYEPKRPRRPG